MAVYLGRHKVSSEVIVNRPPTDETYTKSEIDQKLDGYASRDALDETKTQLSAAETSLQALSNAVNAEHSEREQDLATIQNDIADLQNTVGAFSGCVKEVLRGDTAVTLNTYGASGLLYTDTTNTAIKGRTFRIEYGKYDNTESVIIVVNQTSSVYREVDSYVGYDPSLKKLYVDYLGFYCSGNKLYANAWANTMNIGSDVTDRAPYWQVRRVYEIIKT